MQSARSLPFTENSPFSFHLFFICLKFKEIFCIMLYYSFEPIIIAAIVILINAWVVVLLIFFFFLCSKIPSFYSSLIVQLKLHLVVIHL